MGVNPALTHPIVQDCPYNCTRFNLVQKPCTEVVCQVRRQFIVTQSQRLFFVERLLTFVERFDKIRLL